MKKPLFPPASSLAFCAPQQALDIKNCMNNVGSFLSEGGIMSHIHKTRKYLAITMAVLLAIAVPAQTSLAESAVSPRHAPLSIHVDASLQSRSLFAAPQAISDISIQVCGDACLSASPAHHGFDLYLCSSKNADLETLIAGESIAPIAEQALVNAVKGMVPGLAGYVMRDEALYAFPIDLDTRSNRVFFPDLFEKFDLGSVPNTIDEYIDLAYHWYSSSEYPNRAMAYKLDSGDVLAQAQHDLLERMLVAYVHAVCQGKSAGKAVDFSFDTPAFRAMLEKYKAFAALELSDRAREAERAVMHNLTNPEYLARGDIRRQVFAQPYISPFLEYEQHVLFDPSWDAESTPAVHTNTSFFLLNANSPSKEAALRFLKAYTNQMDASSAMRLHPNESYSFNEDAVAAYREIAAHYCFGACARYICVLLTQVDAPTLIMDYCTGKSHLTEDQALHALDSSLAEALGSRP